jgi:tRNA nucleotidyltransferase/poly(A) polymerase
VYLVGGNLRDVLLGRPSGDRDFSVEGSPETLAARIAAETGGKMVIMGKKQLYRIIIADGSTLDFSQTNNSIETDLRQRDYTVNALGWSPEDGILDPTNGLHDLDRKIVRMTGRDNLQNDPVRIIRAYRLAGELGFKIEPETRDALRELSSRVATSKSERITLEFFRILNLHEPSGILNIMLSDGVLNYIITCQDDKLREQARVISTICEIIDVLPLKRKMRLRDIASQNLCYSGLLYLQSLLWNSSGTHLRLSSRILRDRRHLLMGENVKRSSEIQGRDVKEYLFDLLDALDGAAEDYFIIRGMPEFLSDCERYRQIIEKGLLSTGDIMKCTGMVAGKELGRVIGMMRRAEFYRKISDKEGAVQFLFENMPNI